MPVTKTPITPILITDDVDYTVANQPHDDLETNIDAIIAALNGSAAVGGFDYDSASSTGLNFAWFAGNYSKNGTTIDIAASTTLLTASSTNYVYLNTTNDTVEDNTTGFPTTNAIPLWEVTTDGSSITGTTDKRAVYDYRYIFDEVQLVNGQKIDTTGDPDGFLFTDANSNILLNLTSEVNAVNYLRIDNAASGGNPAFFSRGEANRGFRFVDANDNDVLALNTKGQGDNYIQIENITSTSPPVIAAAGAGNHGIAFEDINDNRIGWLYSDSASVANYLTLWARGSGSAPIIQSKGENGLGVSFMNNAGDTLFRIDGFNGSDNYVLAQPSSGNPGILAEGTATNMDLNVYAKGTGNIRVGNNSTEVKILPAAGQKLSAYGSDTYGGLYGTLGSRGLINLAGFGSYTFPVAQDHTRVRINLYAVQLSAFMNVAATINTLTQTPVPNGYNYSRRVGETDGGQIVYIQSGSSTAWALLSLSILGGALHGHVTISKMAQSGYRYVIEWQFGNGNTFVSGGGSLYSAADWTGIVLGWGLGASSGYAWVDYE